MKLKTEFFIHKMNRKYQGMKYPATDIKLWAIFVALLLFYNAVFGQCPASVSVITTESRCRENGTIKVTALPASSYTYEITAGPSPSGATTSNTFSSLGAGTYEVTVSKGGCFVTVNATVPGNYVDPGLLSATSDPVTCPGGTSCLTMDMLSNGRTPYRYAVVSGPANRPTQASPTFCGLPAGDYTIQALDSCGVIRTTQHSIGVDTGDFYAYTYWWDVQFNGCNNIVVMPNAGFNGTSSPLHNKLKIWYINPNGDTIKANGMVNVSDINADTLTGQANNAGTWSIIAFDECGRQRKSDFEFSRKREGHVSYDDFIRNCGNYQFHIWNHWQGTNLPVHFRIRRCSDNSIVYQQDVASSVTFSDYYALDYDSCYILETYNGCGDTLTRTQSASATILDIEGRGYPSCSDNTRGNIWFWYVQGKLPVTYTIVNGPDSIGMSKTMGLEEWFIELKGLPFGTYTIVGVDACGKRDTLVIPVNATMDRKVTITQVPHCSGGANVHLKIVTNTTNTVNDDAGGTELFNVSPHYEASNVSFVRPWNNSTGTYEADFLNVMDSSLYFRMGDWNGCEMDTTIAIQLYKAPTLNNVSGFVCNASSNGTINYNTLGGLAPFRYRIRPDSTGVWSPWQNNAVFNGISPGSYDVNVEDGCPNGSIRSLTFYTWEKSNIDFSSPCADNGTSFTLSADNKVFAVNYQWYFNNALVGTGDSYTIPSFSTANEGQYKLKQTFQGGQCVDSSSRFLVKCSILPLSFGELKGSYENKKVVLHWNTFKDAGDIKFVVERGTNGTDFTAIGTVVNKGNTNGSNYDFTDNAPVASAFYRIIYAGVDSKTFHSNTARISKNDLVAEPVIISPVPFRMWVTVKVKADKKGPGSIKFFNMAGAAVVKKAVEINKGNNIFWIDEDLSSLAAGPYIVEVSAEGIMQRVKVMKQ